MGKVIVVTHGGLAESFYETARMFIAERSGLTVLGLGVDLEKFKNELRAMDNASFHSKNELRAAVIESEETELLILADLFGGTPFNSAAALCREARTAGKQIEILTGLNLPMLLEILPFAEDMSCSELKEMALRAGREGIHDLMEELKNLG